MDKPVATQDDTSDKEFNGKVEEFSTEERHANKPYGTAEALAFDPLGLRRPNPTSSKKEIEGLVAAVSRMTTCELQANFCNDNVMDNDTLEERKETVDRVIETLSDPNTIKIGLYGSGDARKANLLQRVLRRVNRDSLFDVTLMATVTKKSDIKRIQEEIAQGLGLKLENNSVAERAISLCEGIKEEEKVLVILRNLFKGLDLGKVGIPFGTDHPGSKILLTVTSDSEEILTNHMHTQKNFMV